MRKVCHVLCSVILLCENKTQLSSIGGESGFLEFYDKKSQNLKDYITDFLSDISYSRDRNHSPRGKERELGLLILEKMRLREDLINVHKSSNGKVQREQSQVLFTGAQ